MYKLKDKILKPGVPFVHNGIQYPGNWLTRSSIKERKKLGIVEIQYEERPNPLFYNFTDKGDGTFDKKERDINEIKQILIDNVKKSSSRLLSPTDWKVVRSYENKTDLDKETATYRKSIRDLSNKYESDINNCKTIADLEKLNFEWPDNK